MQCRYKEKLSDVFYKVFPGQLNNSEISNILKTNPGGLNSTMTNQAHEINFKEINSSFGSSPENFNSGYVTGFSNQNNNFNNDIINDDKDDIIKKVKNGQIFYDIRFNFAHNAYENFEKNLKILKNIYDNKVDTLEKNMDYFKSYLENYYRKKIQSTRNNHMENIELINQNLPIMSITSEHNDKLKMLRELYDFKLKELEMVIYEYLILDFL
jgi:hypothetical protein